MVWYFWNVTPTKIHPNQKLLKSSADRNNFLPPLQPSCQEKHHCVWYLTLILWCGGYGAGVKGKKGCQASDRRSSLRFCICRCETTGYNKI